MNDARKKAIHPPALSLPDIDTIQWENMAEMIRFREDTRPRQLLEESVITRWIGKRQIALIADPVAADEVLFRRPERFPKAAVQQKLGHAAFGPGLSGTGSARNRRQRRAFMPLMSERQAHVMGGVAQDAAEAAVSRWLEAGTIDLGYEMAELALQIVWATLLGPQTYEGRDPVVTKTVRALYAHPKADFVTAAEIVRGLACHFEASGRWQRVTEDNPLRAIVDPEGWTGRFAMSQEELRANAVVLAASGHVTTGLTLAWSTWLLALHPEDQSRAHQEAEGNGSEGQASFLRQVVSETLRLFPPGAETMRDARDSLRVADQVIEPGALVIVSIYALHRHRRLWRQPDEFRAERFAPGSPEPVMRSAFLPFSGGPFGCIGAMLAWAEILSVLGTVLRRARIEVSPVDAAEVGLTLGTCIYPDRPLRVQLRAR